MQFFSGHLKHHSKEEKNGHYAYAMMAGQFWSFKKRGAIELAEAAAYL